MQGCKWLSQKTINNNNNFWKMSKKKYGDILSGAVVHYKIINCLPMVQTNVTYLVSEIQIT